jgi:peptide-methionine (S)-S-oxide reductase
MANDEKNEQALLGGGCFWCLEAAYETMPGVLGVANGYAGGSLESPNYEQVCSGGSGHAEVVRITFDPKKLSYEAILELFWKIHDPTSLNRQGADVGEQYRSVIFYADEAQRAAAALSIVSAQAKLKAPIVTELLPAPMFWPAEEYHQGYFRKHPGEGYCRIVIAPKLHKLGLSAL